MKGTLTSKDRIADSQRRAVDKMRLAIAIEALRQAREDARPERRLAVAA